jgi:ATPase
MAIKKSTVKRGDAAIKVKKSDAKLVADTSVVIDGRISENHLGANIIIPWAVLQELEHQSNIGKSSGAQGLAELTKLQELHKKKKIGLEFVGEPLKEGDIKRAHSGRVDEIIREVARKEKATLVTSDKTQAEVAKVLDIDCIYYEPMVDKARTGTLLFEKYFDKTTMSVHLKEDVRPFAKRGSPGNWKLVELDKKALSKESINDIVAEILTEARKDAGLMEIEKRGCNVIQLGHYRIVITRHPFSEKTELTIVKPIVSLTLDDYNLAAPLLTRLESKAEGILIVGPPGSGKTTFAQAMAEFYAATGKIVKTMEHPRDLQVSDSITQYSPLDGSMRNTGDVLLLVRPDYTIYDEVRKTDDFLVFEDMRLAGVGMVGVAHAAMPIDAIQRFLSRVELGVIPQVVDTILFIKGGEVRTVLTLGITVKVPTGMTEQDLARPVVEVKDFESKKLKYEIYTYGEEIVVIPVEEVSKRAEKEFKSVSNELTDKIHSIVPEAEIENKGKSVIAYVPQRAISRLVGRNGSVVNSIEREFGVKISVLPAKSTKGKGLAPEVRFSGKSIYLTVGNNNAGNYVKLYAGDEYIMTEIVNKKGEIMLKKKSKNGRRLSEALEFGEKISFEVN